MLSPDFSKLSQKEQQRLGLPDGFKLFSSYPFGGMNVQDSRMSVEDNEFFFRENFIRIGKGKLRTLWDKGAALYTPTPPRTIVSFYAFNIGSTDYFIVFLDNGTAVQVNNATGAVTTISSVAGTFYNGTTLPACSQWGSQYLLIVNRLARNNYWIWDGSALYQAGTLGPQVIITNAGSGYTSAPTVTAYGGSGTGATFVATISLGSVVGVQITNPGTGYVQNELPQLRFTGGGSDNSAQLTAVLTAVSVDSIVVTNGGSGYSVTPPTVTITGGGGTGATATATLTGDTVTSITVTAGGTGYTGTPTVGFSGGSGSGVTAIALLTPAQVGSISIVDGGTGYTSTPTLSIDGGGVPGGATAVATVTGGVITAVTVTNGGSGYTATPVVVVQSGVNRAASAVVVLMPFGVSGSSIETFQQRVWIPFPYQSGPTNTGGVFQVSVPGSYTDFSTSNGGLTYTSSDSFLKQQYTNIKQSNGYLYPFGDSSVSVISNVQTTGVPSTTTFNYQNTDPQIGTSWRDSLAAFSRSVIFADPLGVFGLYGGSVSKLSSKLDDLFNDAFFPPTVGALTPTSAVANIYEQKVYLLLMTILDPFTDLPRNVMIGWDEKEWFVASQTIDLIYIGTQEINSNLKAWGTDGAALYPLFDSPSAALTKKLSSKLFGADAQFVEKQTYTFITQLEDKSGTGVTLNVTVDTNAINPNSGVSIYPLPNVITLNNAPYPFYSATAGDIYGFNVGYTVTSTSADFVVNYLGLGYIHWETPLGVTEG